MIKILRSLFLLSVLLLGVRCGPTGYQAVRVTMDTTMVATVPYVAFSIESSLDGKPSSDGAQFLDVKQSLFTLLVPRGSAGALTVTVQALANTAAVMAQGIGEVKLDGETDQLLTVRLQAVRPDPAALDFAAPRFVGGPSGSPLASADVNGDQKDDLLAVDPMGRAVQILPNQGGGAFPASAQLADTAFGAQSMVLGDVNKDGKIDVLLSERETGQVQLLLGRGDGTFSKGSALPSLGANARAVAIADLNGDKAADLLLTAQSGFTVFPGKGDGTFGARVDASLGSRVRAAALGDVTGDGLADLVVALEPGARVLEGVGDGTFKVGKDLDVGGATQIFDEVAIADNDIALVSVNGGAVTVVPGRGDGTFRAPVSLSVGQSAAAALSADVNDDRKADLIVPNQGANNLIIFLGNGDGTYQAGRVFAAGQSPTAVTALDADGDGKLDLAVLATESEAGPTRIGVLQNRSK